MKVNIKQEFEIDRVESGTAEISDWNEHLIIKDRPVCIMLKKDKSEITVYLNNGRTIYIKPTDNAPIVGYSPDCWNSDPRVVFPQDIPFYKLKEYRGFDTTAREQE